MHSSVTAAVDTAVINKHDILMLAVHDTHETRAKSIYSSFGECALRYLGGP
jgi:hypothetical protein